MQGRSARLSKIDDEGLDRSGVTYITLRYYISESYFHVVKASAFVSIPEESRDREILVL